MLLENNYYRIIERNTEAGEFAVQILPECEVFQGHFPGHPVCPGVCNMEMVKECAMQLVGKSLTIATVKQCRFLNVITPEGSPQLKIKVSATPLEGEDAYLVQASIEDETTIYLTFKGNMKS